MSLAPLTAARSRPAKPASAGGSRRWTARCLPAPCYLHCHLRPRLPAPRQEREEQERFV